jgi:hypothetical protein
MKYLKSLNADSYQIMFYWEKGHGYTRLSNYYASFIEISE